MVSIFLFRKLIRKYCPNLNILTLDKCPSDVPDEVNDLDELVNQQDVDEVLYTMVYGDISKPESDECWQLAKELPPFNNIHTIRLADGVTARSMFLYQVFSLCPRITSASNFGKKKERIRITHPRFRQSYGYQVSKI